MAKIAGKELSETEVESLLANEVNKTSTASTQTLLSKPLAINEALYPILEESSDFFHQGEWQVLTPSKRFLATVEILTCIGVFAWTNKGRKRGSTEDKVIVFGAHIDAEYYLGCKCFHNGDGYAFLRKMMASAFGQTNPQDIVCHVVGDHSRGCPDPNTQGMGPELVASLQAANYQVNTSLFRIFPGATLEDWKEDAMKVNFRLYKDHQCFFFAAMDCRTGQMIVHNRYYDECHPCPMWPNQRPCDITIHGHGRQLQENKLLLKSSGSFRA